MMIEHNGRMIEQVIEIQEILAVVCTEGFPVETAMWTSRWSIDGMNTGQKVTMIAYEN